jgi:hypothetical protein
VSKTAVSPAIPKHHVIVLRNRIVNSLREGYWDEEEASLPFLRRPLSVGFDFSSWCGDDANRRMSSASSTFTNNHLVLCRTIFEKNGI